jgi:hypothetical protein
LIEAHVQLAPARDQDWEAQRRLIKGAGATYEDRTKTWILRIGDLDTALPRLGMIARAAEDYGAHVRLKVVPPHPEWQGSVIQLDPALPTSRSDEGPEGHPV